MTIFGYARVSADGQALDAQLEQLKAAGCSHIFQEKFRGAKADLPQLAKLLALIGSGDALMVGGLAEFERELIRARTAKGRVRATPGGQPMDRPPALTADQRQEAAKALVTGAATQADLARQFNVSQSTISRLAERVVTSPDRPQPRLDAETERAARRFMQRVEGKYSTIEFLLFGSRARGTHTAESDADLAVILTGKQGNRWEITRDMSGIAFDVMLETGILIQALPLWEDELKRPEAFSNPALIETIKREGLLL